MKTLYPWAFMVFCRTDYEARSHVLSLDAWRARPHSRRLLENAVQMMSPLL